MAKQKKVLPLSDQDISKIYLDGISSCKIAIMCGCRDKRILAILRRNKIYIKSLSEARRKYKFDEHFFTIIDSDEKAYWLGFIEADGCIRHIKFHTNKNEYDKYDLAINLSKKDREMLIKFKDSIKASHPIRDCIDKDDYEKSSLVITSKKLFQDLLDKGCCPRKSLRLTFPVSDVLDEKYYSSFLRGYYDGDGSIHNAKERGCKNQSYFVTIAGTEKFLKVINNISKNLGRIYEHGKIYILRFRNEKAFSFLDFIYSNCNKLRMERKYDRYIKYRLDWFKEHGG